MVRRAIDAVAAVVALVVLAPVLLVVATAVVLTLGRPVLFRQRRTGWRGREFDIVKFRTMRPERHPGETDPDRTPRVGRILRATSLDELPQLWNVLVGDMSLVGPRPTLPEQVARYTAHQRRRLEVRPGITGWAQVQGRNALSWPERIELDIWYVDHRTVTLDVRILLRTVVQLLRPQGITGADGINPGFPDPDAADTAEPTSSIVPPTTPGAHST